MITIAIKGRPLTARERTQKVMPLSKLANRFWRLACAYDGIAPNSPLVNFSDENPYAPVIDRSRSLMFAYMNEGLFPHRKSTQEVTL